MPNVTTSILAMQKPNEAGTETNNNVKGVHEIFFCVTLLIKTTFLERPLSTQSMSKVHQKKLEKIQNACKSLEKK